MADRLLIQVTAPTFTAGLVVSDDDVVEAAPIMKWAIGKKWVVVRDYCWRKKYGIDIVGVE